MTDLDFGENVLLWTYINGFGATTDEVSIWAFDPLAPAASAGPDQTIVGPPFTAQLSGSACIEPCSCTWTLVAGTGVITDVTDPNVVITGLFVGTTILTWTCINGPCGATSDTISINAFIWTGIENAPLATSNWLIFDSDLQQLTVATTEPIDQFLVTDAQGRILHEMSATRTSRTWSMAQHAPGIYIVRAVINGVVRSQRFLVIR